MAILAELATQTPTTLWFDADKAKAKEQVDTVIACGQFTMCFNLLEYIEKVEKQPNTTLSPAMQEVRDRILAAWNQFQQNPKIWVGDNREQALADWEKL